MEHRIDLQVVRGLAVSIVVAFHAFPTLFPSGFLGVDMFFVLSGYLMSLLYDRPSKAASAAKEFYIRRLNRLLPAYLVAVLFSVFAFSFLVLPHELDEFLAQVASAFTFFPNVYFWAGESYFDELAFRPLLHLWSLGVELQFYIFVPLLFFMFKNLRFLYLIAFIASISLCFYLVNISSKTAFFFTPFRVWEFLIGFSAAFLPAKLSSSRLVKCAQIPAWVTLLMCSFVPLGESFHPSYLALAVCLSTVLVILGGASSFLHGFRSLRGVASIGDHSYSIYLIHYPLQVLMNYRPFEQSSKFEILSFKFFLYIFLVGLLSYMMRRWIELGRLFKVTGVRPIHFSIAAVVVALTVIFSSFATLKYRFSNDVMSISASQSDRSEWRCGKLEKLKSLIDSSRLACVIGDKYHGGSEKALLVGDSHADAIKTALSIVANRNNYELWMMIESCNLGSGSCSVDNIANYIHEYGFKKLVLHDLYYKFNSKAMRELLSKLDSSIQIYYVEPVPTWSESVPKYLYMKTVGSYDTNFVKTASDYRELYSDFKEKFLASSNGRVIIVPTLSVFCNPICNLSDRFGRPFYFDSHHLTLTGSMSLAPSLESAIFKSVD